MPRSIPLTILVCSSPYERTKSCQDHWPLYVQHILVSSTYITEYGESLLSRTVAKKCEHITGWENRHLCRFSGM
jgi:hypothetical protein